MKFQVSSFAVFGEIIFLMNYKSFLAKVGELRFIAPAYS